MCQNEGACTHSEALESCASHRNQDFDPTLGMKLNTYTSTCRLKYQAVSILLLLSSCGVLVPHHREHLVRGGRVRVVPGAG